MKRVRYGVFDPEPHGLREMIRYHLVDQPDTAGGRVVRRYGRAMIRRLIAGCERCTAVDAAQARVRRLRVAYGARRRG